jgi:hypothetical protein
MPLFPSITTRQRPTRSATRPVLRSSFAVIELTPRRPRGKHSLTDPLRHLKSIGCRDRRRRLRQSRVRVYKAECFSIGGWR